MKKFIYLLLITITVASCGGKEESVDSLLDKGDLSEIKAKKADLSAQQTELKAKIDKLNTFIEKEEKHDRALLVSTQKLHDLSLIHI